MNRCAVTVISVLAFVIGSCSTTPTETNVRSSTFEAHTFKTTTDCDARRRNATWKNTTLFDLTYACTPAGWEEFFSRADVRSQVKAISEQLASAVKKGADINPDIGNVFRALYLVPPPQVRASIMGQDPAPSKGQATGLSFSLRPGVSVNQVPSVQRVMLEAMNEGFCMDFKSGDRSDWAAQGVLLLNAALTIPCPAGSNYCTVGAHLPLWDPFSRSLIRHLQSVKTPISFVFWGGPAEAIGAEVKNPLHYAIRGGHPSPSADGERFFCKGYFSCSNNWLEKHGVSGVRWQSSNTCQPQPACVWSKGEVPQCEQKCVVAKCP